MNVKRQLWVLGCMALSLVGCGEGDSETGSPRVPAPPVVPSMLGPDPLVGLQWHLFNTGQSGGAPGVDLSLQGVTETGAGIRLAFIDGAVQIGHPDLVENLLTVDGWLPTSDPSPPPTPAGAPYSTTAGGWDAYHGTAVVGIAVGRGFNSRGIKGVAPEAKFMAFDAVVKGPLDKAMRDAVRLKADVVNNSWGTLDSSSGEGVTYQPADTNWTRAVDDALLNGRDGKGAVIVFSAGNGGARDDSNRNGYANHPGVFPVAAVDDFGRPPSYAEPGFNVLISAPSGRGMTDGGIWTTDIAGPRGFSGGDLPETADYGVFPGGTSASASMVSGVVALMLQANPALTWRDVRWILAQTARPTDLSPQQAAPSPMNGHGYHPLVGFGRVDASAAIAAARAFRGLPEARRCDSGVLQVGQTIEDAPSPGLTATVAIPNCDIRNIESVQVTLVSNHPYAADLQVVLVSPTGTTSTLGRSHFCGDGTAPTCGDFSRGWTFQSVRHMGESALGSWQLGVQDQQPQDVGSWTSWRLVIQGH
jgi:proprotein convertase subtilisin/kexin type 2